MGRGRKLIKLLTAAGLGICMLPGTVLADCDVEQISIQMPKIRVYYRADKPETSYEAYLGGEALTYDSTEIFRETDSGVDYYLLLDVSASIPDAQFENLKAGIQEFISTRGKHDRCILRTFGNDARTALNGGETTEQALEAVQALTNEDMETVLFQGIVKTAEMMEQAAEEEEKRRVIVAITDGEDCVTGQETAREAETLLKDKGIPLYALAVDVGKEEYLNSFGEFARNTGGTLSIFKEGESFSLLAGIRETIQNSCVAVFSGKDNVASNQREDFTIKFQDHGERVTREVIPTRWIRDEQPPSVSETALKGKREIRIAFSEPVLGAETAANYQVYTGEEAVTIDSVSYEKETSSAVLTFEEPLYTGTYEISFSNITDASMEKNPLEESCHLETEGIEPEEPQKSFLETWWGLILGILLAVLAAAVAIVLVVYKKVKKNKGILYVDGKAALASNVDVKQHVATTSLPSKEVVLVLRDAQNGVNRLKVTINGSAMIGRSGECEVYFDDGKMSRQHYVLETDGTDVFITDLESQNGTYVNGIRIQKRRKLLPNDEIKAGNITARILW